MSSLYTELRKEYLAEWRIWYRMHQCVRRKEKTYIDVEVYDDWFGQDGFIEWLDYMGPRPKNCTNILRINKFGNYEPGNVKWGTYKERYDTARWHSTESGKFNAIRQKNGICKGTYYTRLRCGWHPMDAATIPPNKHKRYKDYLV